MHAQEVVELMVAFRSNRNIERAHMVKLIDTLFKKVLLDKWKDEVVYNQRVLFGLAEEFYFLEYHDEELWTKILDTAIHKNKINNTHYWVTIHQTTKALNEVPDSPLKGKFNEKI